MLALSSTGRTNYPHFASVKALRDAAEGGERWIKKDDKNVKVTTPPVSLEGMGKESGELEMDASLLMVMTTSTATESDASRAGLVVVAKNRHGRTGLAEFRFWPACGRFTDAAPAPVEDLGPVAGWT